MTLIIDVYQLMNLQLQYYSGTSVKVTLFNLARGGLKGTRYLYAYRTYIGGNDGFSSNANVSRMFRNNTCRF